MKEQEPSLPIKKIPTKQDQKNLEYMKQVFLTGKNIENFEDFIGFVNYIS